MNLVRAGGVKMWWSQWVGVIRIHVLFVQYVFRSKITPRLLCLDMVIGNIL